MMRVRVRAGHEGERGGGIHCTYDDGICEATKSIERICVASLTSAGVQGGRKRHRKSHDSTVQRMQYHH